jgi:Asp-tRNA(Asn)/Glu-tRNA(Gln) amidotransferase A subunit family amidase
MTTATASEAVLRSLGAIRKYEHRVRAFRHVDESHARQRAETVDASPPGPLSGLTVGVKDLIDTATMPTSYGSGLYAGHRPVTDAAVVDLINGAGGCVVGKTVTTEFALMTPGPTTNPHRAEHTPGGSSSGSAAAVAAGMVDIGIGTQTYGSVIRPAAFCGVFGFKPTYGAVPLAGVRLMAKAFDTVGWMARSLETIERVLGAVTELPAADAANGEPRIGTTDSGTPRDLSHAIRALPGVRSVVPEIAEIAVAPVALSDELEQVSRCHGVVAEYQIGRSLAREYESAGPNLSAALREFVRRGLAIADSEYTEAANELARRTTATLAVFSEFDVLLTPCAPGEAPRGLEYTGDPRYCTPWTALGCPALCLPAASGTTGLPIGVQLVAAPGRDRTLLRVARELFQGLCCPVPQP